MLLLSRSKQEPGKWQQYKTDHSSHLQKKWKSQMVQLSLPAQPYVTFFCPKNSDTPSCYQSQHSNIISLLARLSGPDIGMAQQSLKVRSYKPPLPPLFSLFLKTILPLFARNQNEITTNSGKKKEPYWLHHPHPPTE